MSGLKLKNDIQTKIESYYKYIIAALIALFSADLATMYIKPMLLPQQSAPTIKPRQRMASDQYQNYNSIINRNLFSLDGQIPDSLSAKKSDKSFDSEAPARPSTLPFVLNGTIVHANPEKSVASVLIRGKNQSFAFKVGDDIEGMARVTKIERKKLIFINLRDNVKEFIEIPDDAKLTIGLSTPKKAPSSQDNVVRKAGKFEWEVTRTDLNQLTQDLPSLLKQARVEPNFVPGGGVKGFRFTWIAPDSIFSKLGFNVGDVIRGVDGEPINDARSAMEAYKAFQGSDSIRLDVTRDGVDETFVYDITQ